MDSDIDVDYNNLVKERNEFAIEYDISEAPIVPMEHRDDAENKKLVSECEKLKNNRETDENLKFDENAPVVSMMAVGESVFTNIRKVVENDEVLSEFEKLKKQREAEDEEFKQIQYNELHHANKKETNWFSSFCKKLRGFFGFIFDKNNN